MDFGDLGDFAPEYGIDAAKPPRLTQLDTTNAPQCRFDVPQVPHVYPTIEADDDDSASSTPYRSNSRLSLGRSFGTMMNVP